MTNEINHEEIRTSLKLMSAIVKEAEKDVEETEAKPNGSKRDYSNSYSPNLVWLFQTCENLLDAHKKLFERIHNLTESKEGTE